MNLGIMELLGLLILPLLALGVYWLIRLAVTHGIRAARVKNHPHDG